MYNNDGELILPLPMSGVAESRNIKNATNISNAEINEEFAKLIGTKPLPVFLDIPNKKFIVDPKIPNITPATESSAEGLVDDLKLSIKNYLINRKTSKLQAYNNAFASRKAREAVAELNLQAKRISEKQKENREKAARYIRQQEASRAWELKQQRKKEAANRNSAEATRKRQLANIESNRRRAREAAKAASNAASASASALQPKLTLWQRMTGKRTLGGKRRRTHKRRA